jgi:hypothetical protein
LNLNAGRFNHLQESADTTSSTPHNIITLLLSINAFAFGNNRFIRYSTNERTSVAILLLMSVIRVFCAVRCSDDDIDSKPFDTTFQ